MIDPTRQQELTKWLERAQHQSDFRPFRDRQLDRDDVLWLVGLRRQQAGSRLLPKGRLDLGFANLIEVELSNIQFSAPYEEATPEVLLDGADLQGAHLEYTFLRGARLEGADLESAHLKGADLAGAHLEGAFLLQAHLEDAKLWQAHLNDAILAEANLKGADLDAAHLEGADLAGANLEGASLREVFFDGYTRFWETTVGGPDKESVSVADAHWGDVSLSRIDWSEVKRLGDEGSDKNDADRAERTKSLQDAVRANRQLAAVLSKQGLSDIAARFAYRSRIVNLKMMRLQRKWLRCLSSLLLWAVAGYGYRPWRSALTYAVVVLGFAAVYFSLGHHTVPVLGPYRAIVLSAISFHGRGLFPQSSRLGDPISAVAATEAVVGLLIEITFIVTFTRRVFRD